MDGGHSREIGLIEAFERAHEISQVVDRDPLVVASTYRLLLAILAAASGPTDDSDWIDMWTMGFHHVPDYLEGRADRFDLFHPETPFYQCVDLGCKPSGPDLPTRLVMSATSGNTAAYSDRRGDLALPSLTPARAAREMISFMNYRTAFGQSAKVLHPDGRMVQPQPAKDGVLIRGYTFLLVGSDLRQTLLLNFGRGWIGRPSWDWDRMERWNMIFDTHDYMEADAIEKMTWLNRSLRLIAEDDGTVVGVTVNSGRRISKEHLFRDPMKLYRRNKDGKHKPMTPMLRRHLWQDADALLADQAAASGDVGNVLLPDGMRRILGSHVIRRTIMDGVHVSVRACGLVTTGGRASKVEHIALAELPLPPALLDQESDARDAVRRAIRVARTVCENMICQQRFVCGRLRAVPVKDLSSSLHVSNLINAAASEDHFWFRLRPAFDDLVDEVESDPAGAIVRWHLAVREAADQMQGKFRDSLADTTETLMALQDFTAASHGLAKHLTPIEDEGSETDMPRERGVFNRVLDGLIADFNHLSPPDSQHIDRGTISRIRECWSSRPPWESVELVPFVCGSPEAGDLTEQERRVLCLVTMLFGINPTTRKADGDFGSSLQQRVGRDVTESFEANFFAKLYAWDLDALWHSLAEYMDFISKEATPVNWRRLAQDLLIWDRGNNEVRVRWATSYYVSKNRHLRRAELDSLEDEEKKDDNEEEEQP